MNKTRISFSYNFQQIKDSLLPLSNYKNKLTAESCSHLHKILDSVNYSMMPGFGIMCITNRWLSLFPLTSG